MIDPMAAMYAALEAVSEGKAAEIELEWDQMLEDREIRLTITVRRQVRPLSMTMPPQAAA